MKVLVACEESQTVCKAFRARGHEAYSADVQEPSGGHPEWHILGDVLPLINGYCAFTTMDGKTHRIDDTWDLLIAHPPCTYLTKGGANNLLNKDHTIKDKAREAKGWEAKEFFLAFWNADCPRIAVENPVPMKYFGLPPYSQIIEPCMFGDPWRKRTCLWLKGLPLLFATDIVVPRGSWVGSKSRNVSNYEWAGKRSAKDRSKTFPGIARAMAEQWGGKPE